MTRFSPGTYLLHGEVPVTLVEGLDNVFLPVGSLYHLDNPWRGYRRIARVLPAQTGDADRTIVFADDGIDDVTCGRDDLCEVAVVQSDGPEPVVCEPGIRLIEDSMPAGDVFALQTNVFLKVDEVDHLGRSWRKFRYTSSFELRTEDTGETVHIGFADPGVTDLRYPVGVSVNVLMAVGPPKDQTPHQ